LNKIIAEYRTTQETGTVANDSPLRKIAEECGYLDHTFVMIVFVIYANALSECYDRFKAGTDIEALAAIEEIKGISAGTIIGRNAIRLMSTKEGMIHELESLNLRIESTEANLNALKKDARVIVGALKELVHSSSLDENEIEAMNRIVEMIKVF
jgi:hypothetical protein